MSLLDDDKPTRQCKHRNHLERCQKTGWLTQALHGEGPWYCDVHFEELIREKPPVHDDFCLPIDDRVEQIVPRLEGESMHDWSMRCKAWTLRKLKAGLFRTPRQQPMREPGCDDE